MVSKKQVSSDDAVREFKNAMSSADQLRADGLDRLQAMRAVKQASLGREEARLTRKLGANHPRVNEIRGRLRLNSLLMRDLSLESQRVRVEPPEVDTKTWCLHGFVRDKSLKGVANHKVPLFDQTGKQLDGLGHGCTDANGYFNLRSSNLSNIQAAHLRVLSPQGTVVYHDKNPLQPRAGVIDYREIILSGEEVVCIPPLEPGTGTPGTGTPGTGTPGTGTPGTGTPGTGTPDPPPWTVRGHVSDGKSVFFAGLKVAMADKAGKPIAEMGTRTTDEKGKYEFIHPSKPFAALIKPPVDLFVKIFDANQKDIGTSPPLHFEPGKTQQVNFTITPPKEGTAKTPTATEKGKTEKT